LSKKGAREVCGIWSERGTKHSLGDSHAESGRCLRRAIVKLGTKLQRIRRVDPERYRISLEYADGFSGTVDLRFLFETPKGKPLILEILRGNLLAKCFVESGALAWPNGYELCPDAVRAWITEQKRTRAA